MLLKSLSSQIELAMASFSAVMLILRLYGDYSALYGKLPKSNMKKLHFLVSTLISLMTAVQKRITNLGGLQWLLLNFINNQDFDLPAETLGDDNKSPLLKIISPEVLRPLFTLSRLLSVEKVRPLLLALLALTRIQKIPSGAKCLTRIKRLAKI